MFLTPDGVLREWNGSRGADGSVIAELGPQIFADMTALVMSARGPPGDDSRALMNSLAATTGSQLNQKMTGNLFENWAGLL